MKMAIMHSLALPNRRWSSCLAKAVTIAVVVGAPLLAQGASQPVKRQIAADNGRFHLQQLNANETSVEVFLHYDQLSVAELNAKSLQDTGAFASSEAQINQARRISEQHSAMRALLEARGIKVLSTMRAAANGMRVSVPVSKLSELSSLPGVVSIGRVAHVKPNNITSVPWIGAPTVWNNFGVKGKGIRVGVIDTGIDYTHANFGGSGNPADYANNNPAVIEPGTFPTAKVVGGYDFAGADYDADVPGSTPVPDPDPLDFVGHGSHVAGTIAGIGVPGSIGPGVAPEASLYALKVFGDNGGSTNLTSDAIEWAMDPNGDGDMSDHLDVINMSLGSAFGDPNDPSAIASNNAAALGIIVVVAAGNEGATPYIVGSPGVASSVITVAASTPGGRLYAKLTVTAPPSIAGVKPVLEGSGPVTIQQVGPITGNLVVASPLTGCTPLANAAAVAGNIVLIKRGTCTFQVKYQTAQAAGARALIVYNDGADPTRVDPIVMGVDNTVTIPGVMTSFPAGDAMAKATGVVVRLEVAPDPTKDDRIADFSSQGPGNPDSAFKPDISAPGVSIVSTGVGTGTGSANFQGTSMATPHVAGAAALLRQLHPNLNQSVIKALLQNATVNANSSYDTKLSRQGVGVIRVDKAAALTSYASPAGVSFGRLNPLFPIWRSEDVHLTSLNGGTRTFNVKHVPNHTLPGVSVSCPSNVVVRGKRAEATHILLKFDPKASADAGIADDGVMSQTEVDGWCVFNDGKDELRVGYIAVVDPASSVFVTPNFGLKKVTVRNLGPAMGWAEEFTLAKLGGEKLNGVSNAIAALGFRRADPAAYLGQHVLEFGVATEKPFTHPSTLIYDFTIDTDGDGVDDMEIVALDLSLLDSSQTPGTFVSAQFNAAGNGFIDWEVRTWDFNDQTIILPFTLTADGGFLPEKFNYTLHVVNASDNTEDVQHGSVDLSKEIVPDLNSFGVSPKDKIDVNMSGGSGVSLWLFQNNPVSGQVGLSISK